MRVVAVLPVIRTHHAGRFVSLADARQWLDTRQRAVNVERTGVVVMDGLYGVERMLASAKVPDGCGGVPRYRIVQHTPRIPN
ncbi:hypothetical protein HR51_18310 [Burkholderia cepacia]|nr:hypothetical protein HR51_18310 [Burkholderia cepacia]